MKQFNLQQAKAGAPVCTREGKDVRIVCFDAKRGNEPIIALIQERNGCESIIHYTIEGTDPRSGIDKYGTDVYRKNDLFMKSTTQKFYTNIYLMPDGKKRTVGMYESPDEANRHINDDIVTGIMHIAVASLIWEE